MKERYLKALAKSEKDYTADENEVFELACEADMYHASEMLAWYIVGKGLVVEMRENKWFCDECQEEKTAMHGNLEPILGQKRTCQECYDHRTSLGHAPTQASGRTCPRA